MANRASESRVRSLVRKSAPFVVLGVLLNVSISWWFLWTAPRGIPLSGIHVLKPEWPKSAPSNWPACYHAVLSETENVSHIWAYSAPGADHEMRTLECGRPFRSLQAWSLDDGTGEHWFYLLQFGPNQGKERLPWCPLWPGFALNTILYAAVAWGLWQIPRAIRRNRRLARGCCVHCGYDLSGLAAIASCPECGQSREATTASIQDQRGA